MSRHPTPDEERVIGRSVCLPQKKWDMLRNVLHDRKQTLPEFFATVVDEVIASNEKVDIVTLYKEQEALTAKMASLEADKHRIEQEITATTENLKTVNECIEVMKND